MKILSLSLLMLFPFVGFAQKTWSLQDCIDHATKNNLRVIQSLHNKGVQDKALQIAKNQYLPSVSGNMDNNLSFGQGRDVFGGVRRNDNFNHATNLAASMQLYNHGNLKRGVDKAQHDLQTSLYDMETVKNDISLLIVQGYLQTLLNKEIYNISKSAVENAQKLYDRAKITTEVGTTPLTIQYEADANLSREKQRMVSSKVNVDRALFDLAMLLQLETYQGFEVEDVEVPSNLTPPLDSSEQILSTAYAQQPQIKAAEEKIKASEKQVEITKTRFYPTVNLNAGVGTSYFKSFVYDDPRHLFQQYSDNFGQRFGLSVSIPIFNKGITKLQVEQAKIGQSLEKNGLDLQKQEVKKNVQKAYFDAHANYANYQAAVHAEKSARLALDFAQKSYEAGKTTIYDLNIARNNWVTAQGNVSQTKYNYVFSLKLLNFYAGKPLSW